MNSKLLVLAPVALALSGCVIESGADYAYQSAAPVAPRVYFFPTQGQTAEQQDRDRYDCHTWAVGQTGYDPSRRALAPNERTVVMPARNSGDTTLGAAIAGALIGAAVSDSRNAGTGALVGAAAGGLLGAASEDAQAQQSRQMAVASANVGTRRQSADYQRAMSACLEARGYTVK